jgi:cytochrome c oxidase assembly protein subunit 15
MNESAVSGAPVGRAVHRFAVFLSLAVVFLITAGALVKSKEAGLSVPDWPLSFGSLNPPRWYEMDGVKFEHGHRLFAGTIALLTFGLALWLGRREPRRWVRRLGWWAVGAVLAQALLGGLTVLLKLPPAVSIAHAALAQIFLCLIVTIAVVTGPRWLAGDGEADVPARVRKLRASAMATTGMIFVQVLLGAMVRHFGAGMAIPDFPLAFGRLVPMHFDLRVGLQYAHRVMALLIGLKVLAEAGGVLARYRAQRTLLLPTLGMTALVVAQVTLGAYVIWTARAVVPNTLHVATGASLLACSLILALHGGRLAAAVAARQGTGAGASARGAVPMPGAAGAVR